MTNMLKGGMNGHFLGPFLLILAMKLSFAKLCNTFAEAPVKAHFISAKPICLESNALRLAIAGIISQQQDRVHGSAKENKSASKGHWHLVAL
jgi:hypothetical protein